MEFYQEIIKWQSITCTMSQVPGRKMASHLGFLIRKHDGECDGMLVMGEQY